MPSQRPTSGPGRSRRPGASRRPTTTRSRPVSRGTGSQPRVQARSQGRGQGPAEPGPARPRFTGRAVVLVLVLAVLAVSYASSMRAYLTQRAHIHDLKEAIAEREASIDALEREKRRWQDPAYVRAQARKRFGYVMPGETGYRVLDANGDPLDAQVTLAETAEAVQTAPEPWWSGAWESMELAGNPPPPSEGPAERIDGTAEESGG